MVYLNKKLITNKIIFVSTYLSLKPARILIVVKLSATIWSLLLFSYQKPSVVVHVRRSSLLPDGFATNIPHKSVSSPLADNCASNNLSSVSRNRPLWTTKSHSSVKLRASWNISGSDLWPTAKYCPLEGPVCLLRLYFSAGARAFRPCPEVSTTTSWHTGHEQKLSSFKSFLLLIIK